MRLIGLAVILTLSLTFAPLVGVAQQTRSVPRIGILDTASLNAASPDAASPCRKALDSSFRQLGYVPGQNIILEYRSSGGQFERQRQLAVELVQQPVDVIIAGPNNAISAAREATSRVPIVMAFSNNPVDRGFVQHLARPGGNITGLSIDPAPETSPGKQLSLLKELIPSLSRVAVISSTGPTSGNYIRGAERLAGDLGIAVQLIRIDSVEGFEAAFTAAQRNRAEAAYLLPLALAFIHRQKVADLAMKYRMPTIYFVRDFVDVGGLMSYGVTLAELCRRLPSYVDKILKGAKPADLPVELPTKLELVINLKTAKALGLTIPQTILLQADQVIE